jgi:hypothetical protein
MNFWSIIAGTFGVIAFVVMLSYLFFPRQAKNFYVRVTKRKRFVVCHMRYANTKYEDEFIIVPESDFITKVKSFSYDLNPKYSIGFWKKRLHFVLDENNSIPLHFTKDNNEEIMYQAMEIQNALNNNVTEYLFTKRKEILIMGLFIVAIVAVIALIYSIMRMNELLEKINLIGDMLNSQVAQP